MPNLLSNFASGVAHDELLVSYLNIYTVILVKKICSYKGNKLFAHIQIICSFAGGKILYKLSPASVVYLYKWVPRQFSTFFFSITQTNAQSIELSLDKAIEIALHNNLEYDSYKLKAEQAKILKNTAFTIDNLEIFYGYDQNNVAENGHPLNIVGIEQSLSFPAVYASQYKVNKTAISLSEKELENQRLLLIKNVSQKYYEISYLNNKDYYYRYLDTLYPTSPSKLKQKHKNGAPPLLIIKHCG